MLITSGGRIPDFEQLMQLHQKRILGIAFRLMGNLADAQDTAQEVFMRLHRHIDEFSDDGAVLPWLRRVTVNLCIDGSRKKKTVPIEGLVLVHSRPDPEQLSAARQASDRLQEAMTHLSARERAVLVLRELEGLTTAEVAAALGTTESTVRVQIARSRLKLRELLKGARQ